MIQLERTVRRRGWSLVRLGGGLLLFGALAAGMLAAGCGREPGDGGTADHRQRQYQCPMHPTYVSDRPGDCPICGMKLVPVHADEAPAGGPVEGHASVEVSADESRLAGLTTSVARRGTLARTIRTVGEVKADETRVSQVNTRVSGWVEELFVGSGGQAVRKGQPLLSIYSPELLATQEEFLRARESVARFTAGDVPEARSGGTQLLEAARQRLLLFDVPRSFVDRLESTGQSQRSVTLEAPASGFVTAKDVLAGARIEPGMTLFTVTDLSKVWIEAEVYEYEASLVRLGQPARVTLAYDPSRSYTGRIGYIYPYLNTDSRTLRVRFEFDNPGLTLKPGMYVNVELDARAVEGVLVPDAAILDTGPRQIVYVMVGEGRYEPRQVTVGLRSDGQAQILSGVKVGEAVVDRANFLLDSESRLRSAIGHSPAAGAAAGDSR